MSLDRALGFVAVPLLAVGLGGCATTPATRTAGADSSVVSVAAAENFWGSLAAQLGGVHASVTSVIRNPDADPHDYEPTAADGRSNAAAKLVIINGVGYDAWAGKLAGANPATDRTTITVGDLAGAKDDDNPNRWYNQDDVSQVI